MMDQQLFGDERGSYAKVIADSVSLAGHRLTTMEVQCHRFVLAEFNTHRKFSRNSASSRAIPVAKQIARVIENPAFPLEWRAEQKGMQGGDIIEPVDDIVRQWEMAAQFAASSADVLSSLGVHKSIVNRLLEPFMWHKIIVSSTEWENFFSQRCSPLAQPEIRAVAEHMRDALNNSVPQQLRLDQWHAPYFDWDGDDAYELDDWLDNNMPGYQTLRHTNPERRVQVFKSHAARVSAARCARVSYLTHDGQRSIDKDIELYRRLRGANPPHWSPMEHPAQPRYFVDVPPIGNFDGWIQMREMVEAV
jgi:thymidylate synthase ThyX